MTGYAAAADERCPLRRATRPSPPPSPRRTGKREDDPFAFTHRYSTTPPADCSAGGATTHTTFALHAGSIVGLDLPLPLPDGNVRVHRTAEVHEERFVELLLRVPLHHDGDRLARLARRERQRAG